MAARERTIHLIDGSAQFYRAYFAIRGLSTSRGLPTNATYGFTTMLRKLYQDEDPKLVGISFDVAAPTFRHEEFKEYKATRRKMDDELRVQLPYVRRVCEAFRLPIIELSGWEADDVIATLATQAVAAGYRVVVVSGDKDLLQLVTEDILVLNPGREGSGATLYDRAGVEAKFGVPPERVVDVLALVGDSVDNVPGVPGIGDKGARDLVREYGSLEGVLENARRSSARVPAGPARSPRRRGDVEAPGHAAPRRAGHARPGRAALRRPRPHARARALHRARVRGARQGVRAGADRHPHGARHARDRGGAPRVRGGGPRGRPGRRLRPPLGARTDERGRDRHRPLVRGGRAAYVP
jgi:5'-3' exonuclease